MRVLIAAVAAIASAAAAAAPHIPASDGQVLERLPIKPSDPLTRELRQLRAELAARPSDQELAVRLARRYFDIASAEGDPRYIGYAEAVIRPWATEPDPPTPMLMTRALLLQWRHDFGPAMADLDKILARDPNDASALMWRVALHLVQADYPRARADCDRAQAIVSMLSAIACHAVIDGRTGKARAAYEAITSALLRHPARDSDQKQWMLTRLAELALAFGDKALAERHFREAMSAGGTDAFVLAEYADFLLDERRPAEVVAMLREWVRNDSLLLRLALAETALGTASAPERARTMEDRFAAAALRRDTLHQQEEARFELALKRNARRAVELAAENWKVQREPRDARILLEAALAAGRPEAAQGALDWLRETGFEDPRYRALGEALRKMAR